MDQTVINLPPQENDSPIFGPEVDLNNLTEYYTKIPSDKITLKGPRVPYIVEDGIHQIYAPMLCGAIATADKFAEIVEDRVWMNDSGYIEEVSILMEELDLEPEDGLYLISKTLMGKIQAEALVTNRLKEKHRTNALIFE